MNRSGVPAGKGKKKEAISPLRQPLEKKNSLPKPPKWQQSKSQKKKKKKPQPQKAEIAATNKSTPQKGHGFRASPWAAAFPWAASLPLVACIAGSGRMSSRIGFYIRRCERLHIQSIDTPPN